jgi:hypothetical protein
MKEAFAKAEELAGSVKDYVNTRIESVKLGAAAKSSAVMANMIAAIAVAAVLLLFVIMLSAALAFGLGEWTGKLWLGFLIVAVLYLLLGMMVWVGRKKLIQLPIMNSLIEQFFTNDEMEENEED